MNIYERAAKVKPSELMQDDLDQKVEVVSISDKPQNIQTKLGSPVEAKIAANDTAVEKNAEQTSEQSVEQTNILNNQTEILQRQGRQLSQLNNSMDAMYNLWFKEFNKIDPKIDDRPRTPVMMPRDNDNLVKNANAGASIGDLISDIMDMGGRGRRGGGRAGKGGRGGKKTPNRPGRLSPRVGGGIGAGGMSRLAGAARFLGPAAAVASSGYAGWEVGTWLNNNVVNPGVQWATGDKNASLGTWIYDKIHGDEDLVNSIPSSGGGKYSPDNIAKKAAGQDFGSVSGHFESGGRGVHTVSTGKGDKGGVSYGKHQLSSKTGTMKKFLESDYGAPYREHFRGMTPGTMMFSKRYKEVAESNPGTFEKAQQEFMVATHFNPMASYIKKEFGLDVGTRSRAMQELIYSVATQYGASGTGKKFISEALGGVDLSKVSDEEIIRRIQDYRAATVHKFFKSSSSDVKAGVAKRAGQEKAVLLKMLEGENNMAAQKAAGGGDTTSTPATSTTPQVSAEAPKVPETLAPMKSETTAPATETKSEIPATIAAPKSTEAKKPSLVEAATPQMTVKKEEPAIVPPKPVVAPPQTSLAPTKPEIQKESQVMAPQPLNKANPTPVSSMMPKTATVSLAPSSFNTQTSNVSNNTVNRDYFNNQEHTISAAPLAQTSKVQSVPDPVVRQEYTNVQKVMAVDQPAAGSGPVSGPAPAAQQSSSKEHQKLSEFPAFIDDFGLLFVNSGFL